MTDIGSYAVPVMVIFIIAYASFKKTDCFSAFTDGIKTGVKSVYSIFPALFALFISIGAFRASGLVDVISEFFSPVTSLIGFPSHLVPFAILRPVSGSGSLAFASDVFSSLGPDSFEGRVVSVMMGSTETTFYTAAVYFGAAGTKNIRHTLKCALIADAFSMAVSLIVCTLYY